jgi:hypothetical protein
MKYFIIEYYQEGCKKWTRHTFTEYTSLEDARKEVNSYKEHKLGIKFRILKVEEIK